MTRAGSATTRSMDDYLARVPADKRAALERLRRLIKAAVPAAEETISYGLAAFRLDGRVLVLFGATPNHCSFYPGSGTAVEALGPALRHFETSKGTIRFQPEDALPAALVRRVVKYRLAEEAGRAAGRPGAAESRRPTRAKGPTKNKGAK